MRSRINWLKWGDKNSKYFHATTVQRRQRNRIVMLKNEQNEWCQDPIQLKEMTAKYFKELYTSTGQRNFQPVINQISSIVKEEMNQGLIEEVTLQEVTTTTFQLGALKAPGPDGLCGKFYQHHWKDIHEEVFREVKSFFNSGTLNPELNHTYITLISKIHNPKRLEQFRPISLYNFAYKIILKIMANRLKQWLPNLIATEQSAFVSERQIRDNILIVQEVLHQLRIKKRKKKFHAVLKVDMKKAYDRVEWDFLKASMLKMGFCDTWVSWVMECVSTVSFNVKVNDEPSASFKPTRGIR